MVKANEIINFLEGKYPSTLRAVWDSTDGYLEGDTNKEVKNVGIGLEINEAIIKNNFDMLILHHPPRFGPDKRITNPFYIGLSKNPLIYVLHSRIDRSGDLNKSFASAVFSSFIIDKVLDDGTVIISLAVPLPLFELVSLLKSKLNKKVLKVIPKKETIKKIAIHGGEGFNQHHVEKAVKENIDLYLAGDLVHHLAESAYFQDITFIDIEHTSEQIGMEEICKELQSRFFGCDFKYIATNPYWKLL